MTTPRSPSLLDAMIPIVGLVIMLAISVYLFGDSSSSGPNQIVLTLGAAIASNAERPAYLLHADLPLLTPAVLRRAFRIPGPVIAPSYDGGTTLLGPVPSGFTFAYGVDSYTRHLAVLPTATPIIDARLALDIDSARDLKRALATHRGRWLLPLVEVLNES